jgi:nucleoside-diphosphate-sugar epimerase
MANIAITGGLGHIGSSFLHDETIKSFGVVTVVDNFLTNRHCSLFHLPRSIQFYELDITKDELAPVFQGADIVLHLAGIVNAGDTYDKEGVTQETNSFGVGRVVKAAEEAGVKTLIYVSTTSVYGPDPHIRDEFTDDLKPQSPYATYKLEGEPYVLNSLIPHVYVIRAGTIFGYSPGMRVNW